VNRTLGQFAAACGGELGGADRAYTGVSTDTRTIKPGELFVALRGPRFDANEFVAAAEAAGAAGAVVDRRTDRPLAQVLVADTQEALTVSSAAWRAQFQIPVVGVAGSNGKTTVKEMTAAILSCTGSTLATRGSLNNHIGVPLTLHRLERTHRFAVIEIGTNHPGEVAALCRVARPTVGLITNAGAEHLEGFGSIEVGDHLAFGASGVHTTIGADGFTTRFELRSPQGSVPVELRLAGRHNVVNALCAAAAAVAAGASLEDVRTGLATMRPVPGRLQLKTAPSGAWIVDDSYNANPSSMKAGIEVLETVDARRWFVMGDMGELGDHAAESHRDVGRFAREHRIDRLFATGKLSALAVEAFGSGGEWFADAATLARAVNAELTREVCVLVKGSRSARLERVVEALTGGESSPH
jgi:UDP-N-acetylmuramoyl-tripeptide--D-alanyl-D-alanine ligase